VNISIICTTYAIFPSE